MAADPLEAWLSRSSSSWTSVALRYSEYGDPQKVLNEVTETLPEDLGEDKVALEILASPINPADINIIQGVYAIKPPLPAVGGSEAVARVLGVGSHVKNVKVGDRVIPSVSATGTWRTKSILPASQVLKIPEDIPLIAAATISVNPCTAWRMLWDFTSLRKGDVIVQNGANSAVGQAVIQIAAANKWKTVNIIRDRPNKADTVKYLSSLGASYVMTDADFKHSQLIKDMPKAKLGLNCVGGKAVADMVKLMDDRATIVTYGGMSKQPMMVPTSAMIFKDLILCGFWMTRWNADNSVEERTEMFSNIVHLIREKQLKAPLLQPVLLKDFRQAIQRSQEGFAGEKQIFVMDEETHKTVQEEINVMN